MARDGSTRKVSSSYQQVNRRPIYKVKTASLLVESGLDTSHLQVMRAPTNNTKAIISVSQKILNAVEITIHGHKAHALIDPCTINVDLISVNFYFLNKIPTEDMDAKPLETAIKGSRPTMTTKVTVELNIRGNEISRTFYISNLSDWDAILGPPFLATLNVIMDVQNNMVFIQPIGKPRQQLYMLQKQSHAVSTAACAFYNYHHDISYDSSSHVPETDTEDEEAEFARYHDGSAAHIQSCMYCLHESYSESTNAAQVTSDEENFFPESLYDSHSNSSTPEE